MNGLCKKEQQYIAFNTGFEKRDYTFAVPVENIGALLPAPEKDSYVILPHVPDHVLCVMKSYEQPVTVINLLKLFGFSYIPETANIVVILNYAQKSIGIPAQSAYMVSTPENQLTDNELTGTKVFTKNDTEYYILDIPRLYRYIGI